MWHATKCLAEKIWKKIWNVSSQAIIESGLAKLGV